MKTFFRLLPVILSAMLLAAHFLRDGALPLTALSLLLPFLLLIRRAWAARLVQIALAAGTVIWWQTLVDFVAMRQAFGQPWTRLAVILGAVAALTLGSALVFYLPALRERYNL